MAAILISKEAGLGLADIRTVLTTRSVPARREVIARHREMSLARIARAQAALDMLQGGMEYPHEGIRRARTSRAWQTDCGRLVPRSVRPAEPSR